MYPIKYICNFIFILRIYNFFGRVDNIRNLDWNNLALDPNKKVFHPPVKIKKKKKWRCDSRGNKTVQPVCILLAAFYIVLFLFYIILSRGIIILYSVAYALFPAVRHSFPFYIAVVKLSSAGLSGHRRRENSQVWSFAQTGARNCDRQHPNRCEISRVSSHKTTAWRRTESPAVNAYTNAWPRASGEKTFNSLRDFPIGGV